MTTTEPRAPRDQESWARPVDRLSTTAKTTGLDTVTGKRVSGPIQGFGQMWQKTFVVRVPADEHSPEAVVAHWKAAFPTFWPKGATFYTPLAGITPGEVALFDVPPAPGSPVKMSTGILVIYADRESFTFMTSEGHALSGLITFSAYRDHDDTVVQVQALERTSDPLIELTYMLGANNYNDPVLGADAGERGALARGRVAGGRRPEGVRGPEPPVAARRERPAQRRAVDGRRHDDGTGALAATAAGNRLSRSGRIAA